jgi:hypothetical protein
LLHKGLPRMQHTKYVYAFYLHLGQAHLDANAGDKLCDFVVEARVPWGPVFGSE